MPTTTRSGATGKGWRGWQPVGMQRAYAYGVSVPETVGKMCSPATTGVLVYDAQVGILPHVRDRDGVVERIQSVLAAARAAGVPVIYVRHVSVPPAQMGVAALRTAMAWQRTERAEEIRAAFPPGPARAAGRSASTRGR